MTTEDYQPSGGLKGGQWPDFCAWLPGQCCAAHGKSRGILLISSAAETKCCEPWH